MEKIFEVGLVLGRFHPMHKGHMEIIDIARKLCKKNNGFSWFCTGKWNSQKSI